MKTTVSALLLAGLSWGAVSACGEKHDFLGSRANGGGPSAGSGGTAGMATGGTSGSGETTGSGGNAGRSSGGSPGSGGGAGAAAGAGAAGGNGGSGGGGGEAGATGGGSGEAGGGGGGTAGSGAGGMGGGPHACPTDCTVSAGTGCPTGEVPWSCGAGFDHQELIDAGCTDQGTALPRYCCPAEAFSGCSRCADIATLAECDARTDCHPVFTDPGPAACACAAVGCCTRFLRCADGGLANCLGPATCDAVTPYCPSPAYVVSIANSCYEGCVRPEDCAPQLARR